MHSDRSCNRSMPSTELDPLKYRINQLQIAAMLKIIFRRSVDVFGSGLETLLLLNRLEIVGEYITDESGVLEVQNWLSLVKLAGFETLISRWKLVCWSTQSHKTKTT